MRNEKYFVSFVFFVVGEFLAVCLRWNELCSTCAPLRSMYTLAFLPPSVFGGAKRRVLAFSAPRTYFRGSVAIQSQTWRMSCFYLFPRSMRPRAIYARGNSYRNHAQWKIFRVFRVFRGWWISRCLPALERTVFHVCAPAVYAYPSKASGTSDLCEREKLL